MCDQLSSIGVEFNYDHMSQLFLQGLRWAAAHPFPYLPSTSRDDPLPWANDDIFPAARLSGLPRDEKDDSSNDPGTNDVAKLWETARPWSLGQTRAPTSLLQKALGETIRRPGLFMRINEDTNEATHEPLLHTGEAIHSSARVRLACGGLDMNDEATWTCRPLRQDKDDGGELWVLEHDETGIPSVEDAGEEISETTGIEGDNALYSILPTDGKYQWVYTKPVNGTEDELQTRVPQSISLPEEPLVGPSERLLLALTTGEQDVWRYAENKYGA